MSMCRVRALDIHTASFNSTSSQNRLCVPRAGSIVPLERRNTRDPSAILKIALFPMLRPSETGTEKNSARGRSHESRGMLKTFSQEPGHHRSQVDSDRRTREQTSPEWFDQYVLIASAQHPELSGKGFTLPHYRTASLWSLAKDSLTSTRLHGHVFRKTS